MPETTRPVTKNSSLGYAAALLPFLSILLFLRLDIESGPAGDQMQGLITLLPFIFLPAFGVVAAYLVGSQEPGDKSRNLFRLTSIAYGLAFLLNLLFGTLLLSSSDSPHLGVAAPTFYFGLLYFILLTGSAYVSASLLLLWSNSLPADPRDSWLVTELRDRAPMYHGLLSSLTLFLVMFVLGKFSASDGQVRAFLGSSANILIPIVLLVSGYVSVRSREGAPGLLGRMAGNARNAFWLLAVMFLSFTAFEIWFSVLMFTSKNGAGYSGITSPSYSCYGLLSLMVLTYCFCAGVSLLVLWWNDLKGGERTAPGDIAPRPADGAEPQSHGR